jgi:hypothetical protein
VVRVDDLASDRDAAVDDVMRLGFADHGRVDAPAGDRLRDPERPLGRPLGEP